MNKKKLLVITPISHISGLSKKLEENFEVSYLEDPTLEDVLKILSQFDAIFTNPNKSKVYIGREIVEKGHKLKAICTASTGTNHIDKDILRDSGIELLSLTEERSVINQISSTAELAFALTLMAVRKTLSAQKSVMRGEWDYTKFIGRQMDRLTIGVIGYGRLGSMYAKYCSAFNSKVIIYDPFKSSEGIYEEAQEIQELISASDVISLHVHVNSSTVNMINKSVINKMKPNAIMVNTSRGDLIDENDLVDFLKRNPNAILATDVLSDEVRNRLKSPVLEYASQSEQIIITPHIGGMTVDAQEIAYHHAAKMLVTFFEKTSYFS